MNLAEWPDSPGIRWLAYMSLRRDDLCESPRGCNEATEVSCKDCGNRWEPEDIRMPGECPSCGSRRYFRERCAECPLTKLEDALQSDAGAMLARAAEIRAMSDVGIQITLGDLTVDEARALIIIQDEATKHEAEKARRQKPHGQ